MSKNFSESVALFNTFLTMLAEKGIKCEAVIETQTPKFTCYEVIYQDFMLNFFNEVSDISVSFLRQFINLNNFKSLITNETRELMLMITIYENYFDMRLGNNRYDNLICFNSYISKKATISCSYRNRTIGPKFSYDDAYNMILYEIKQHILPDIIDSSIFLNLYAQSDEFVIQQKLESSNHRYISHDAFCEMNKFDKKEKIINVEKTTFLNFLKDSLSVTSNHKLLQILSLIEFDAYVSNKNRKTPIKISFPTVSKFSKFNTLASLVYLDFGILLNDDGTFYYEDTNLDTPVYLNDLDDIYNHLLQIIASKISKSIETPLAQLTRLDIEMYKMVVY